MKIGLRLVLCSGILGCALISCREVHEHLVIDAGSSGTRFCRFPVEPKADGCHFSGHDEASCIKIKRPLARASVREIEEILSDGLSRLGLFSQKGPALTEGVLVLGTGGFRALPKETQRQQIQRIAGYFQKRGLSHRVQVLGGKAEGELAYRSISELHPSLQFRTLEVGGATIQFALLNAKGQVEAWSSPLGINQSLQTLRKQPTFRFCYSRSDQTEDVEFEKCKDLLIRFFRKDLPIQEMQKALEKERERLRIPVPTFGLGGSWRAILSYANRNKASAQEIRQTAKRLCLQSPSELVQTGIPSKYARRACYLVSYGSALLEVLRIEEIRLGGKASWPHGAALDERFYPECRAAQAKQTK